MIHTLSMSLLITLVPSAVLSEQSAVKWVQSQLTFETRPDSAGLWRARDGAIYAVDPLTLHGSQFDPIAVPETPAKVVGLQEQFDSGRTAVLLLVWSDAPVVCGEDISTIGVDTGLAGFMTASDVAALERYDGAEEYGLYSGIYAEQIDENYPGPFLTDLPEDTRFPMSDSGWGDGGYPVATLIDAEGQVVALYAQFITDGADWLLPPPCAADTS